MPFPQQENYTINDIYALPEGTRAELIDGQIYYMAPPSRRHQKIAGKLFAAISHYIDSKGGSCEPYIAPFAVFLNEDDTNYVEPDISVICDTSKLTDKGCDGAPDWIPGSPPHFGRSPHLAGRKRPKILTISIRPMCW